MVIIPMHTRDTAGTGHGVPRCAKVDYHTRTRTTHFGNTTGFSIPMLNPKCKIRDTLAHFKANGDVNVLKRQRPTLHRSLQDESIQVWFETHYFILLF